MADEDSDKGQGKSQRYSDERCKSCGHPIPELDPVEKAISHELKKSVSETVQGALRSEIESIVDRKLGSVVERLDKIDKLGQDLSAGLTTGLTPVREFVEVQKQSREYQDTIKTIEAKKKFKVKTV